MSKNASAAARASRKRRAARKKSLKASQASRRGKTARAKQLQSKAEKKYRKASKSVGATIESPKARHSSSGSGLGANKGRAVKKDANKNARR